MTRIGIALSILQTILVVGTIAAYSTGDVNPQALRGVWRLTSLDDEGLPFERKSPRRAFLPPPAIWAMKEFTTYPKKKKSDAIMNEINVDNGSLSPNPKKQTEIFIKLKEDYTFEQCTALQLSDGTEDENDSLEEKLQNELSKREKEAFAWKGTWDYVDGKLILAADRPEKKPFSVYDDQDNDGTSTGGNGGVEADTILVGKVKVNSEESLTENPALEQRQMTMPDDDQVDLQEEGAAGQDDQVSSTAQHKKGTIDVHFSVPKGKIKTGKFMYPKDHPSFFEQPIYRPESKGRFELRQILGDHNAKLADDEGELIELFRKKDLVGKRFYLSTFPIPKRKKKFERWDKTELRYVQDEYELSEDEKKEEELKPGNNMQVMAVELFANNTFSTLYGLGSSTVLRGRWNIIGEKRDQLWMMVSRFGFGRSVSGSTFSEGTSLTQNDEKAYWGKITEIEDGDKDSIEGEPTERSNKKLEIEGAVMVGWGLEPTTLGRFKMIEIDEILEEDEDEEEEEEEYEEMSADDVLKNADSLDSMLGTGEDHGDSADPFNLSGAFE